MGIELLSKGVKNRYTCVSRRPYNTIGRHTDMIIARRIVGFGIMPVVTNQRLIVGHKPQIPLVILHPHLFGKCLFDDVTFNRKWIKTQVRLIVDDLPGRQAYGFYLLGIGRPTE